MKKTILAALLVAGCTSISAPMASKRFEALSTTHLWSLHYTTADPLELALIEAELGLRGETNTYSDFLGRQTRAAYGRKLYSREPTVAGDKNSSDFAS
ncbi:hypothetical protein KUV57_24845 [Epibacterium sp. DP7N7-1]|nr:hypothetical protein [Epibacterium sp. DP7N7-1]